MKRFYFCFHSEAMILLKSCCFCVLIVILCLVGFSYQELQTVYVKSVRCNVSEKVIYRNISCYPKSFNRSFSTVNIIARMKTPITKVFVSFCTRFQRVFINFCFHSAGNQTFVQIWNNLSWSAHLAKDKLVQSNERTNW